MTKLRMTGLVVVAALTVAGALWAGNNGGRVAAQSNEDEDPALSVVTVSPIIAEAILDLVNAAAGGALGGHIYDADGMNYFDVCVIAYALRTATGDEDGAAELNPNGNALPCETVENIPKGALKPEDFALLDALDGEQVSEASDSYIGGLIFLVFDNEGEDDLMTLRVPDGQFHQIVGSEILPAGRSYECDRNAMDPDCTDAPIQTILEDGIVPAYLSGPFANRGDVEVEITSGRHTITRTVHVVGEPVAVTGVSALDAKVAADGGAVCRPDGEEMSFVQLLSLLTLSARPDAGLLLANVVDSDGTALANVPVDWQSSDEDVAIVGFSRQFSLVNSGLTIGPNLVCGVDKGTATITASVRRSANDEQSVPKKSATAEITVVGRPAQIVLYAEPSIINCDGVTSTSVKAALLDKDAEGTAAGYEVRFDVAVLGTADPIVAETGADGIAISKVTPLLGPSAGVPVVVTGPLGLSASTFIGCSSAASGQPTAPGGTTGPGGAPGGVISGPDTGSGGSLGNVDGRGALPLWPAMALLAGAMGLIGARFALRRTA